MHSAISQAIRSAIRQSIEEKKMQAGLWTPASLFSAGENGVWYDPSDMSTMFQDAAGTTPVTAVGQPVGRILDKSGRGNHATQTTTTSRPVLQQDASGRYYLLFDGVDDFLVTPSIDFTGTDKVTVFAGVRKLSDAARGFVAEINDGNVEINKFVSLRSSTQSEISGASLPFSNYEASVHGSSDQNVSNYASYLTTNAFTAPTTSVLSLSVDIALKSIASASLRANALVPARQSGSFTGTSMSGNLPNAPLYIGRRGGISNPFNGHLYSLIVRGAQSTAQQIASAEAWVNQRTGAY